MGSSFSTKAEDYTKPVELESKVFPELMAKLPSMEGKVVAITGCTTGTGFVLAKACARLRAEVIMLNRPSKRSDAALEVIKKDVPKAKVSQIPCYLNGFDSVREAGEKLRAQLGETGLDILCNNAGIMAFKDAATVDGFDTQMQVNHLSHFLLTAEVWPLLERAASKNGEARVVNHSCGARKGRNLEAKYLGKNEGNLGGDESGWTPFSGGRWVRYQQTKLANVVFTYALHDRLKAAESKVKVLVADAGLASTNLQVSTANDGGMGQGFTNWLVSYGAQSSEDGAAGILTCCCAKDVESGQLWGPSGLTGPAICSPEEKLANEDSRTMLWADSNWATNAQFNP